MDTTSEMTGTEEVSKLSTVYKQPKLTMEQDYEKRVRDAIARTAQLFRDNGMDPVKAEILSMKLALKHERSVRNG
jgi:uncharacterized protein YeeX (DUF496 family)